MSKLDKKTLDSILSKIHSSDASYKSKQEVFKSHIENKFGTGEETMSVLKSSLKDNVIQFLAKEESSGKDLEGSASFLLLKYIAIQTILLKKKPEDLMNDLLKDCVKHITILGEL